MIGLTFARVRSLAVVLLLTASLAVTVRSTSATPVLSASGIDLDTFYDNFDDNSIDSNLWAIGSFDGADPAVAVNETGSQLVITPGANQSGSHYNGLISGRTYNLTQGILFVQVVESTRNQAYTMFMFGADSNNRVVMNTESGTLRMNLVNGGSRVGELSIPYDSVAHRWWRIRHVSPGDTIRFDTSPDGISWTQRHSIARGSLNITTGKVNISAGTRKRQSTPGRAVFDNLSWHPLVPNKGDWSAPTTAISSNPTPGAWDHILYGAASPSTMVKFNGTYFLYYLGSEGEMGPPSYEVIHRSLGVATSTDGVNFTKYASNPIITYTTTGGAAGEEGIGGATAIVVGTTIHLYYAAIRSIGGGLVDLDIRYRSSTNGYTFTNDTLVFRSPGDEFSPLGVTLNGGTWSVYMKGPLRDGEGAISRLSGTSPTNLPNRTSVTATTFGAGGNADYISGSVFTVHLDRREPAEDRFQVRSVNLGSPDVYGEPLFTYTFGAHADEGNPATFRDPTTGKWFMYTLNLALDPVTISVRTYTPPQVGAPTSTLAMTPTSTLTMTLTSTATITPTQVGVPTSTPKRSSTPPVGPSNTPTGSTATSTPTLSSTPTGTFTPTVIATRTPTPKRTYTPTP